MIIKRDLRRVFMSIDIYAGALVVLFFTLFLSVLISSGTKFGISIFGNLTIFTNGKLILLNGANYTKGIGIIVAILVSLFIAKEYRYKTFAYMLSKDISRRQIYISKLLSSIFIGVILFMTYEIIAYIILRFTDKAGMNSSEFGILLIQGILIYSVISSFICFISMSLKNYILSLILSIMFMFLESNIVMGIGKIMNIMNLDALFSILSKYSLYGMNEVVSSGEMSFSIEFIIASISLVGISTLFGIVIFNRKEI